MGRAAVGSATLGSAAVGSATLGSAAVGSATVRARDRASAHAGDLPKAPLRWPPRPPLRWLRPTPLATPPRAHAPVHMQVLSLRHSRPAKSGYAAFSMGITPYGARKAQKMPKQAKSKGEVKPNERGKNKARGRKALNAEAGAAVAEAHNEAGVGNAMDAADPLESSCSFRIVVVAEDRSTTTYVLHVHLEPPQAVPSPATLALRPSHLTLTPTLTAAGHPLAALVAAAAALPRGRPALPLLRVALPPRAASAAAHRQGQTRRRRRRALARAQGDAAATAADAASRALLVGGRGRAVRAARALPRLLRHPRHRDPASGARGVRAGPPRAPTPTLSPNRRAARRTRCACRAA